MKKSLALFVVCSLYSFVTAFGQDIPAKVKQSKWFRIMTNDSSYNYLEAEADFQKFYASFQKEKIKEEKKRERNKASAEELHLETATDLLVADYLKWSIAMQPFVLADGRILPLAERLAIIKQVKGKQTAGQ